MFIISYLLPVTYGESWSQLGTDEKSFGVIRQDKKILLFPILSITACVILVISFFVGFFFLGFLSLSTQPWVWVTSVFLIYTILFFIVIFFNTAVTGCASIRLNGGKPTLSDGFRIAIQNVGRIFLWTIFSATIGVILQGIREKTGLLGKIVAGIVGIAWSYVTFFIIPVLIFEKKGVLPSIRRSAQLFKETWGETIVGTLGFGIIFSLIAVAGIIPIIFGVFMGFYGIIIGLVIAFIYWIIIAAVSLATNAVYVTALYQYATKKELPLGFDASLMPQPNGK